MPKHQPQRIVMTSSIVILPLSYARALYACASALDGVLQGPLDSGVIDEARMTVTKADAEETRVPDETMHKLDPHWIPE